MFTQKDLIQSAHKIDQNIKAKAENKTNVVTKKKPATKRKPKKESA
jgi:hypothetical protein